MIVMVRGLTHVGPFSPCVIVGSLQVLRLPPMHLGLGHLLILDCLSVCVCGCFLSI